jgi:KAP family P-loop domain/WD domain, G-beta repeat
MGRGDGGLAGAVQPVSRIVGRSGGAVTAIAAGISGGRAIVAAGGADGTLTVWALAGGHGPVARQPRAHEGGVHAVTLALLAGRPVVVSGGADGTLRVWQSPGGSPSPDPDGLREAMAPLRAHTSSVNAVVAVERDGRTVLIASGDGGILDLWQLGSSGTAAGPPAQLLGAEERASALALAAAVLPRRLTLTTGHANGAVATRELSGVSVPFVDIRTHTARAAAGPVDAITVLTIDGAPAVATGGERGINLWSMSTLRPVGSPLTGHDGNVRALAAGQAGSATVLVSGGDDGSIRVWAMPRGEPVHAPLTGHTGTVRALALIDSGDESVIVSGGDDGTVRSWPLERASSPRPTAEPPKAGLVVEAIRDHVDWVADAPADRDLLRRAPLATVLATRMRRLHSEEPTASFLIHLDGPWGSGKSTLLNLLERELGEDWLVVWFDAWRQSRIGQPWWALLMSLRRAVRRSLGPLRRPSLRMLEGLARARRTGAPYLLAFGVLAAAAIGVAAGVHAGIGPLIRPTSIDPNLLGDLAQAAPAAVVAVAALWAGSRVLGRFLLWDSASGARLFMESGTNPMREVAEHFSWLLRKARRPVAFFIDDLDRCRPEYVVELLDTLQTTLHGDGHDGVRPAGVHFVVAADGAWIRESYEASYERFGRHVSEPGRPLGHLFIDKIFQLTVPVPVVGSKAKEDYLRELLHTDPRAPGGRVNAEVARVRTEVSRSRSEAEVVKALQAASPAARELVADVAVKQLALPSLQADMEHALQRFAPLLSPNPRSMKRFVNAYGILRAVRTLEGVAVGSDTLALWTILQIRWPSVAAYLMTDPEAIRYAGASADQLRAVPRQLRSVFARPELGTLVRFRPGGPLTPELIRSCCGDARRGEP